MAQKHAEKAPFKINLSDTSLKLLEHLNDYGRFRYLETSYFIYGPKLVELDKAIWELRRYCRVMNYLLPIQNKEPKQMLALEIERNEAAEQRSPQDFHIVGGALESILTKQSHPARGASHLAERLLWQVAPQERNRSNPPLRRELTAILAPADTGSRA